MLVFTFHSSSSCLPPSPVYKFHSPTSSSLPFSSSSSFFFYQPTSPPHLFHILPSLKSSKAFILYPRIRQLKIGTRTFKHSPLTPLTKIFKKVYIYNKCAFSVTVSNLGTFKLSLMTLCSIPVQCVLQGYPFSRSPCAQLAPRYSPGTVLLAHITSQSPNGISIARYSPPPRSEIARRMWCVCEGKAGALNGEITQVRQTGRSPYT